MIISYYKSSKLEILHSNHKERAGGHIYIHTSGSNYEELQYPCLGPTVTSERASFRQHSRSFVIGVYSV
jgi:hypothetical protein